MRSRPATQSAKATGESAASIAAVQGEAGKAVEGIDQVGAVISEIRAFSIAGFLAQASAA